MRMGLECRRAGGSLAAGGGYQRRGQSACVLPTPGRRRSVGRESRAPPIAQTTAPPVYPPHPPYYFKNLEDTEHARYRSALLEMVPVSRLAG